MVALNLALVSLLTLPHVWGGVQAWRAGEPGLGWLAGIGAGLLAAGLALFVIRRAIDPELDRFERSRTELDLGASSATVAARDTNDYLRDVSHEIRATMQAVLGLTQLLSRSPLDGTQHRQTRTIDGAARALLRIINDLLAFSGPGPHRFDLVPMGCSLHDMLRISADLLEPSATDKGLALELLLAPDLPDRVLIDVGRAQQVVLGVCRHAIETCEQGPLRIEARPQRLEERRFELSLTIASAAAPAQNPAQPSRPDGVVEPAPASQAGLSLSRRLLALMGGSLELGDAPRSIELVLPMPRVDGIPEAPARGRRPLAAPLPIRLPATVSPLLVVEGDERAQLVAVELLENLGFDVEVASSAARALERAPHNRYALILLATQLPDGDGPAVAASLRAQLGSRPAIVGCASEPLTEVRARPGAAAFDALLPKPLERADLCAALAEWLQEEVHPASSGTRLSQAGAFAQATRRLMTTPRSTPASAPADDAPEAAPASAASDRNPDSP